MAEKQGVAGLPHTCDHQGKALPKLDVLTQACQAAARVFRGHDQGTGEKTDRVGEQVCGTCFTLPCHTEE